MPFRQQRHPGAGKTNSINKRPRRMEPRWSGWLALTRPMPICAANLLQEIHVALWRSFRGFDGRCSLRTWIYRVSHNVGASHVLRQRRVRDQTLVGLEELENLPDSNNSLQAADRSQSLERLLDLVQRLKPIDRHVILSYLEGFDAASIGEITGLSAGNVATKIHRIKSMLARQFQQGGSESCVK